MTEPADHQPHEVQPPPDENETVQRIAELLLVGAVALVTAKAIRKSLKLAGIEIGLPAILLALKLADHEGTSKRGTKLRPRARGSGDLQRAQARMEMYYRAAFILSAARRIQERLDRGASLRDAVSPERGYWAAHERARRARQEAARAVADMATQLGSLWLSWRAHYDDRVTPECKAADGCNFRADRMPRIGWPGMPHGGTCRCVPWYPIEGARTVDEATRHLVPSL